jgi:glycosyltransferase involved in cell wall biosynthesis
MKVSVCMITYNHEKFIAQAIESVMMQKASFGYELVIGEDCSSDATRDICVAYKEKYPGRILLLLRKKNLGMMPNFIQTLQACQGEYIALCEGDDYWTSLYKLQKQVDFLDSHPGFAICSHNVKVVREGAPGSGHEWLGAKRKEVSVLEDLLREGSSGATCSLVFRNRVFGDFPAWYHIIQGGDWALQVLCASRGKLYYFREVMGVYRQHDCGALYAQTAAATEKGEETIAIPSKNSLKICDALDKHFSYRYKKLIRKQKAYWYWVGALDYASHGRKATARAYFLKALPNIFPLPYWLTIRMLVTDLQIILLPSAVVRILSFAKSLTKRTKDNIKSIVGLGSR